MNAVTHRQTARVERVEEPMRSCDCGQPLVTVLLIDGEDCAVCEGCLAANSHLIQDAPTELRGAAILDA